MANIKKILGIAFVVLGPITSLLGLASLFFTYMTRWTTPGNPLLETFWLIIALLGLVILVVGIVYLVRNKESH